MNSDLAHRQKASAENILAYCNFKGCFSITNLPDFKTSEYSIPFSYIVYINSTVCHAVIQFNQDQAVVFNPAEKYIITNPKLVEHLSDVSNVTIIHCDDIEILKYMFGAGLYFIYHCYNDFTKLQQNYTCAFPCNVSYIDHMNNIHDFLKCKDPINYNAW